MKRLESSIESSVVAWAKKRGIISRKMNGFGFNSWPDRAFFLPGGRVFFIEFKRLGESLEPLQENTIAELRKLGYDVAVHDDKDAAILALQRRLGSVNISTACG